MPTFAPKPRAVRDIDHQLRDVQARKRVAEQLAADALALRLELDRETDALLALRQAEMARHA